MTEDNDPWADLPSVERARLRAKARSRLWEMGVSEEQALADGISLEALGCMERPHERLPYQTVLLQGLWKRTMRRLKK